MADNVLDRMDTTHSGRRTGLKERTRRAPSVVWTLGRRLVADPTTFFATIALILISAFGAFLIWYMTAPAIDPSQDNFNNAISGQWFFGWALLLGCLASLVVIVAQRYERIRVRWFATAAAAATAVVVVFLGGFASISETSPVPSLSASDYRLASNGTRYPVWPITPEQGKEGFDLLMASWATGSALAFGLYALNHSEGPNHALTYSSAVDISPAMAQSTPDLGSWRTVATSSPVALVVAAALSLAGAWAVRRWLRRGQRRG